MKPPAKRQLHIPSSLADALEIFEHFGTAAEFFAGGTWIMRADHRDEFDERHYISIVGLEGMTKIEIADDRIRIGAGVTHVQLAEALAGWPGLAALASAAAKSANPAIRAMATVGGNICSSGFAAADLVPALLCLSASVEIVTKAGNRTLPIEDFLAIRDIGQTGILSRVIVPRASHPSTHVRLPLKKAGDYPVAIVSVSASLDAAGRIEDAVIAIGSVESVARRWRSLEEAIRGAQINPAGIAAIAAERSRELRGRDGVEAPGWYRVKVVPELVRRAFNDLLA